MEGRGGTYRAYPKLAALLTVNASHPPGLLASGASKLRFIFACIVGLDGLAKLGALPDMAGASTSGYPTHKEAPASS